MDFANRLLISTQIGYNEAYKHAPLETPKSIRLLRIQPGEKTDVISADLFEAILTENPVFEALSYTWQLDSEVGKPREEIEDRPILVNGKVLRVTMNLYHALLQLRQNQDQPPIWADQICMDQHNSAEKVHQLAIMEEIYRSAVRVRIWLGKLSSARGQELGFLHDITEWTESDIAKGKSSDPALVRSDSNMERLTKSFSTMYNVGLELATCEGAATFLSNRWFMRGWTLQEFLLAKEAVFCIGDQTVSHETLITSASNVLLFLERSTYIPLLYGYKDDFQLSNREYLETMRVMFDQREQFHASGKKYSAEEYLRVIRQRQVAVAKDKIFAGAALLRDHIPTTTYSMTSRDIYVEFATKELWPQIGNAALGYVGGMKSKIEGLPSWVPDLNTSLHPEPLHLCNSPTFGCAVPIADGQAAWRIDGDKLIVQAVQWDTVRAIGESGWAWRKYADESYDHTDENGDRSKTSTSVNQEFLGLMFPLLNAIGITYEPTQEATLDVLWQIFIAGLNKTTSKEEKTEWRKKFQQWFAFSLCTLRSAAYMESNPTLAMKLIDRKMGKRWWAVSVIADMPTMEQRLARFLEVHDTDHALRDAMVTFQRLAWGADSVKEASMWGQAGGSIISELDNLSLHQITEFLQHFVRGYEGRRILATVNGYLGSSVEDVRVGDVVCFIGGTEVPYVLRPVTGKENAFTLVGEAYVHGIMDGKAVDVKTMNFSDVTII